MMEAKQLQKITNNFIAVAFNIPHIEHIQT